MGLLSKSKFLFEELKDLKEKYGLDTLYDKDYIDKNKKVSNFILLYSPSHNIFISANYSKQNSIIVPTYGITYELDLEQLQNKLKDHNKIQKIKSQLQNGKPIEKVFNEVKKTSISPIKDIMLELEEKYEIGKYGQFYPNNIEHLIDFIEYINNKGLLSGSIKQEEIIGDKNKSKLFNFNNLFKLTLSMKTESAKQKKEIIREMLKSIPLILRKLFENQIENIPPRKRQEINDFFKILNSDEYIPQTKFNMSDLNQYSNEFILYGKPLQYMLTEDNDIKVRFEGSDDFFQIISNQKIIKNMNGVSSIVTKSYEEIEKELKVIDNAIKRGKNIFLTSNNRIIGLELLHSHKVKDVDKPIVNLTNENLTDFFPDKTFYTKNSFIEKFSEKDLYTDKEKYESLIKKPWKKLDEKPEELNLFM